MKSYLPKSHPISDFITYSNFPAHTLIEPSTQLSSFAYNPNIYPPPKFTMFIKTPPKLIFRCYDIL